MNSSEKRQTRAIHRTICIGLGGTGRDVIMRIRRLIVDRYGDFKQLPIVSFVHIDTDQGAAQISGLPTGSNYHGVDLRFQEQEKISATMTVTQVTNFVKGLQKKSNYGRSPYDHISSWFPYQLLTNIRAVEEGAKGIRPVGRLAFFQNYERIKKAFEAADERTRGHESTLLQQAVLVQPGLHVFVVGSLCGGTGSGMFLDVAYTLRKSYGNQGVQIAGYLVMDPSLYGNTTSMIANTYAALKELNYYTSPSTTFTACYNQQRNEKVEEQRPPFNYTYLVSGQTAGDYKITAQRKLCNVIAQKISLGFYSELETHLKSTRDNFYQAMLLEQDDHPRPNVQGYLTFGLAAIYFPRDAIVQMALNRISKQLGEFWLNGDGQNPDAEFLLDRFLLGWYDDLAQKDGFKSKLKAATIYNNKTFSNALKGWINELERKIDQCENKDDRMGVLQQLPRELRRQFNTTQPGESDSSQGIWVRKLQESGKRLTERLKQDTDRFFDQLLTPGAPDFCIRSSRNWLEALITELNSEQRDLEEELQGFSGARSQEDLEQKWQDGQQTIGDIEKKARLPWGNQNHRQVQEEAKRIVREAKELIEHNFDLAVAREALEIVKTLQQQVQERTTQAASFSGLVENLKSDYDKQEDSQKGLNQDELSGEAIFQDNDIEEYSDALLSDMDLLLSVSEEMTAGSGRGKSLGSFVYRDRLTEEQLKKEINLAVDRLFGSRSANIVQSVIKRFMTQYNSMENREYLLRKIQQDAQPLLDLDLSDPYYHNDTGKEIFCVGFKDKEEPEVKQFKKLLRENLTIRGDQIKSIQEEEEILFVNEYAGFPLRLIKGLEDMRDTYSRALNSAVAFLHNDASIPWGDIIPPDADLMEYLEDIFYPLLALGNRKKERLTFDLKDELRGKTETVALSVNWGQALEEMANRADMIAACKEELAVRETDIEQQPHLWEQEYLPKLRQFVEEVDSLRDNHPNYPYKEKVVGRENGVIERFRLRMEEKIKKKGEPQSVTQPPSSFTAPALKAQVVEVNDTPNNNKLATSAPSWEKLQQLVEMKKEGYLSEEEFAAAKKKILGL